MLPTPTRQALLAAVAAAALFAGAPRPASAAAAVARYDHSMTLMSDGNIFIVGGFNTAGAAINSVQIFITTAAKLENRAVLPVARASHTATLLPDGRVLVAGGVSNGIDVNCGATTICGIGTVYDPRTNIWTNTDAMAVPRFNHTATLLPDGKVLIAAGQIAAAGTLTTDCDRFDPLTNSFNSSTCGFGGAMQMDRAGHTATLLNNGKVFVAGGYRTPAQSTVAVTTELYDPVIDGWSSGPALIQGRAYHTATQLGNQKVLLSGGFNGFNKFESRGYLASTEVYDPNSGGMSPAAPMAERKAFHTSTLMGGGKAHVYGGLGNITTSYMTGAQTFVDVSTLGVMRLGNSWLEGTVLTTSNLNFTPNTQLSVPVTGRIQDGEIFFSSPTVLLTDAKVEFTYPEQTSSSMDGMFIELGKVENQTIRIDRSPGVVHFIPQAVTALDDVDITGTINVSVLGGESKTFAGASTLNGTVRVPFPASDLGGTVLAGAAILTDGSITRASLGAALGFVATLSSGVAPITGNPVVQSNATDGTFADLALNFTGVTGSITNSTTTTITNPNLAGLQATGLQMVLFYIVSPIILTNASLNIDIATIAIRSMIFADQERYSPSVNQWTFGTPGGIGTEVFNHGEVLLPNGDEALFGGRSCIDRAACSAGTFTAKGGPGAYIAKQNLAPWTAVGSMFTGRSNHTLSVLPDGRILAAGGSDASGSTVKSELFDQNTRTWTPTADLKQRLSHHTATLLTNGTVLVTGGFTTVTNSTGVTNHTEIYYPNPGAWVTTGQMTSSRAFHASALLPDGNLLVMGGFRNGIYLSTTEIFFSTGHNWVAGPDIGEARAQFTTTVLRDGRVLVAGGVNAADGVLKTTWLFNPANYTWAAGPPLNTRRHSHTATMLRDGRVLVVGGNDGTGEIGMAEIFDPATTPPSWTPTTAAPISGNDLSIPRLNHTATLLPDGKVLIVGGFTALGGPILDSEGFDVDFSTFQMQGVTPSARGDHATILLQNGSLLNTGGFDGLNFSAACEVQYYGDFPDASTTPGGVPRLPTINSVAPTRFLPGNQITVNGTNFKGLGEASGGGAGSANSAHAHPRVYLSRADGASSSGNDSGWMVDLTSGTFNSGINTWQKMDSSLSFTVPYDSATMPLGWYHLRVAANSQFSQSALVQVGPPAPTGLPGTPSGQALGPSSITWTWAQAGGAFDGYSIYSATSGVFISTLAKSGLPTETFLQTGLGPDTSALIKVAVYNIAGDGLVVFATVSLRTLPSSISDLHGIAQSENTILWSWTPVAGAVDYRVYSATTGLPLASPIAASFSQTLLSTNTAASIRVQAIMPGGPGELAPSATTFTGAAVPGPGQPPIAFPSTGSFLVQWLANTNPTGTLYHLKALVDTDPTTVHISSISGNTMGIANLEPNTLYALSVAAFNGDGMYTGFTSLGSTYTLANSPINAQITSIEPSAVGLIWERNGNPVYTSYQVLYSSDNFVADFSTHIAFSVGYTSAATTVGNLITGQNYTFRVTARNLFGQETAIASTRAFVDNGGGPAGSLSVLAGTSVQTLLSGVLGGDNRRLELRVFPGAFDSVTRIFVSTRTLLGVNGIPAAQRCGDIPARIRIITVPDAQPKVPVEIGLTYTVAEIGITPPSQLVIVRYDDVSGACVPLESTVDTVNHMIYARTNHFTDFQIQQVTPSGSVGEARAFPNPLHTATQGYFTFDHVPANSHVRVFTIHGEEVFNKSANASGLVTWRAENQVGRPVASGIYLAVIESGKSKHIIKLVVIR